MLLGREGFVVGVEAHVPGDSIVTGDLLRHGHGHRGLLLHLNGTCQGCHARGHRCLRGDALHGASHALRVWMVAIGHTRLARGHATEIEALLSGRCRVRIEVQVIQSLERLRCDCGGRGLVCCGL